MALSGNAKYLQRFGCEFGYAGAAGTHIYAGALLALNAAGTVQPIQTAGSLVFAGLADGERNNVAPFTDTRAVNCHKGTWALPVTGATAANVGAAVYATDDNTVGLGSYSAAAAAGGSNHGNGSFTVGPTPGAGAKVGNYLLTFTSATTFTLTDPNGDALAPGASLGAYSDAAMAFTLAAGTNAFQAGDYFAIAVAETGGGLLIGRLAGIDNGQTYVTLI